MKLVGKKDKVVANQFIYCTAALKRHTIYKFQLFAKKHSAETALLRVSNDALMSSDADNSSVLLLHDLSSALATVNHVISWLRGYVSGWAGQGQF